MKRFVTTIMLVAFTLVACESAYREGECPEGNICYDIDAGERVAPTTDNTIAHVQVHWYDSYEDLQNEWAKTEEGEADAWSECFPHVEFDRICEIHVVRPEFVWGDPRIDDLGHELLHTLWGDFHVVE